MSTNLKYKVDNIERFSVELMRFVDAQKIYKSEFLLPPWDPSSDYTGELKWAKFTIYRVNKYFKKKRLSLLVKGNIEKNVLTLKIRFPHLWQFIFSAFILIVFSVKLMTALSFKFGLILLAGTILQTFVTYGLYLERKQNIIDQIEKIIYKM